MENIHSSEHASNGAYCPCMANTNILHCPINAEITAVDQIWQCCDSHDYYNADTWVMLREQIKIAQIC